MKFWSLGALVAISFIPDFPLFINLGMWENQDLLRWLFREPFCLQCHVKADPNGELPLF